MQIIDKPWGKEEHLVFLPQYMVKRLTMKAGKRCSLQTHQLKTETIYILEGTLTIIRGNETFDLYEHGHVTILPGETHRMEARHGTVIYLECSTTHPNDVIRWEDDYGRSIDA